jgi:hypothetical protein
MTDSIDQTLRRREDMRIKVDAWIAAQPEPRPTRSEAIRRLLAEALAREADAIRRGRDGEGPGVRLRKAATKA